MIAVVADSLGAGLVFVAAGCGGLWGAIHLRSHVIERYEQRLPMTEAALDERAAQGLRELSHQIAAALGIPSAEDRSARWLTGDLEVTPPFDPNQALAPPSAMQEQLGTVKRLLRDRAAVRRYVDRMCWAGPALTMLAVLYIAGSAFGVLYFAEVNRWRTAGYIGMWTAIGSVGLVAIVIAVYTWYVFRFDKAQRRAS